MTGYPDSTYAISKNVAASRQTLTAANPPSLSH